jgi:beta-mannosidase
MQRVCLNGEWRFRESSTEEWLPASVPGGVYSDLLAAGEIPDPYYADNELDCQWVGETDWEYRRTVRVPESLLAHDRIILACDGLDTVATVRVNGTQVGSSANMHRAYEFDVADALVAGENEVTISFRSPVEYGIDRRDSHEYDVPALRYPIDQPARNFVRKAQCHYGWDWGPCLPTMGIWRDVSIVAHSTPLIEYTRTEQDHIDSGVVLTTHVGLRAPTPTTATVSISVAESRTEREVNLGAGTSEVSITTTVDAPQLWWPNGHGDQPLYDLNVAASTGSETHRWSERIGFREVELVREADDIGNGESFGFAVNGEPVFAKGANWIPTDALHARAAENREDLLEGAAAANMNTIRVWGGGYYEHDAFYDRCDELGLLVWQDFMFACGLYPADEAFLDSVRAEARYQVRRLNSHPALALWCGNNENEEAVVNWFGDEDGIEQLRADYDSLYLDTIGPVVEAQDPDHPYWPASPSSGSDTPEPYEMNRGDVHYWDVWHEGAPFSEYETIEPRFVSEFGYQSFPSVETIASAVPEGQHNPTAPLMEHHQRHASGNRIILQQMADTFRVPFSFEDFTYLSQIQQGLAMRTAIEHFRRLRPHCMGALYWQLNDLWPGASWSSIDYGGEWKALQHFARRFYAPVLVSMTTPSGDAAADGGTTLEDVSMTATDESDEASDGDAGRTTVDTKTTDEGPVEVWVTNDTADRLDGEVVVEIHSLDGDALTTGTHAINVPGYDSEAVATVELDDADPERTMVTARYADDTDSYPTAWFGTTYKRLDLPEPAIDTRVEGSSVTVRTDAAALFVAIAAEGIAGTFSDNYFHLAPGDERTVTFDGNAAGQSLENALSLRSLHETY